MNHFGQLKQLSAQVTKMLIGNFMIIYSATKTARIKGLSARII